MPDSGWTRIHEVVIIASPTSPRCEAREGSGRSLLALKPATGFWRLRPDEILNLENLRFGRELNADVGRYLPGAKH
jgi:hypothetical protein